MDKQSLLPKVKGRRCRYNIGNGAGYLKCSLSRSQCPFQRYCKNKRLFECMATKEDCSNFQLGDK